MKVEIWRPDVARDLNEMIERANRLFATGLMPILTQCPETGAELDFEALPRLLRQIREQMLKESGLPDIPDNDQVPQMFVRYKVTIQSWRDTAFDVSSFHVERVGSTMMPLCRDLKSVKERIQSSQDWGKKLVDGGPVEKISVEILNMSRL